MAAIQNNGFGVQGKHLQQPKLMPGSGPVALQGDLTSASQDGSLRIVLLQNKEEASTATQLASPDKNQQAQNCDLSADCLPTTTTSKKGSSNDAEADPSLVCNNPQPYYHNHMPLPVHAFESYPDDAPLADYDSDEEDVSDAEYLQLADDDDELLVDHQDYYFISDADEGYDSEGEEGATTSISTDQLVEEDAVAVVVVEKPQREVGFDTANAVERQLDDDYEDNDSACAIAEEDGFNDGDDFAVKSADDGDVGSTVHDEWEYAIVY